MLLFLIVVVFKCINVFWVPEIWLRALGRFQSTSRNAFRGPHTISPVSIRHSGGQILRPHLKLYWAAVCRRYLPHYFDLLVFSARAPPDGKAIAYYRNV